MNVKEITKVTTSYDVVSIVADGPFYSEFHQANLVDIIGSHKIMMSCVEMLSKSHDTHGQYSISRKKGLAIGRVQSGKTTYFLSLIAMAFDNGFEIATIFTGTKNNLKDQTYYRVKKSFSDSSFKDLIILDSSDFVSEKDVYKIEEFSNQIRYNIELKKKVIIIGLKHYKHIKAIEKILRDVVDNTNHMIIDDEGDQASLNGKVNIGGQATTYSSFLSLINSLKRVTFISVTATPQANLFISTYDYLSPDFCVLIEPGEGYTGIETFHGELEHKLIRNIYDSEKTDILDGIMPESLKEAITVFLIGSVIRNLRDEISSHAMLIHPSYLTLNHSIIEKVVKNYFVELKQVYKLSINDDLYLLQKKNFNSIYKSMMKDFSYRIDFGNIYEHMEREVNMTGVIVVNSNEEYETSRNKLYSNKIFIGGNMVERGLTIDNLAISYITRHSKGISNIDTIEQRARWFGYKASYIDLCRVYCTKKIRNAFSAILEHEEQLWNTLKFAINNNMNLKEYTLSVVINNPQLEVTRRSVISNRDYIVNYSGITSQQRFLFDADIQSAYSNYMENLFQTGEVLEPHNNEQRDKLISLSSSELRLVLEKINSFGEVLEMKQVKWIEYLCENVEFINLYLMRYMIDEEVFSSVRSFKDDYSIKNLLQGVSLKGSAVYKGDRYTYENTPHIQVHLVHPRVSYGPGLEVLPYIAVNIPFSEAKRVAERRMNDGK